MTDPAFLILDFQNNNTTNYGVILEITADKTVRFMFPSQ